MCFELILRTFLFLFQYLGSNKEVTEIINQNNSVDYESFSVIFCAWQFA